MILLGRGQFTEALELARKLNAKTPDDLFTYGFIADAATALGDYAASHPDLVEAALHPQTRGYLEFHIEQGPVLEKEDLALGLVEAIAGQSRATITFC